MSLFQTAIRIIDLPPHCWHEVPLPPPKPQHLQPSRPYSPRPQPPRRVPAPRLPRLRLLATVLRVAAVTALEDAIAGLRQGGARLVFATAGATLPRMAFA